MTPLRLPAILSIEMSDDEPIVVYGTPNGTTTFRVSSTAEAGFIATGNVLEAAASEAGFLRVRRKDRILVIATGMESGEMIGGRGHYRKLEVVPATEPAIALFSEEGGDRDVRWVPEYLLHPVEPKDLFEAGEN